MDKPVCSENRLGIVDWARSREGKIWTESDTLVIATKVEMIVRDVENIKAAAQEVLQLHG